MHKIRRKAVTLHAVVAASFCFVSFAPPYAPSSDVPLLKRIRDYRKEEDLVSLRKQIDIYLEKNPSGELSQDLRLLLGDVYVAEGNYSSALEQYAVLSKESLLEKSFYNKALCLYELGELKGLLAMAKATSSQKHLSLEQASSIRYLAGRLAEKTRDPTLTREAISMFEACKNTPFAGNALSSLISLHLFAGEANRAVECCLSLAKLYPESAPDFFLEAALLQAEDNPKGALNLLETVLSSSSEHKGTAAYDKLLLIYRSGNFEEFLRFASEASSLFSLQEAEEITFLSGKALYRLGRYEKAYPFSEATLFSSLSEEIKVEAGLYAFSSAAIAQDINSCRKIRETLLTLPLSEEMRIALDSAYLDVLEKWGNPDEFLTISEEFLLRFPDYRGVIDLRSKQIQSLHKAKRFEESLVANRAFRKAYPDRFSFPLIRLEIDCLSTLSEENPLRRAEWIDVVQNTLSVPDLFSEKEKERYLSFLAEVLFTSGRYSEASEAANGFLTEFEGSDSEETIRLIRVLCSEQEPESKLFFALEAEKFLEVYPNNPVCSDIGIRLFNTYINQATPAEEPLRSELFDKGAEHLYAVFARKNHTIEKNNLIWLANHYYEKAFEEKITALPKAISLFETLLTDPELHERNEENVYKLSRLLSASGDLETKSVLLEEWLSRNGAEPGTLQKHLLYELADTHKILGNGQRALDLYNKLILTTGRSELGAESMLERCKIVLSEFASNERNENNPVYREVLQRLKDLENDRYLEIEPVSVEAGLTYAEAKAALLSDPEARLQEYRKLLLLCLDNFRSAYSAEQRDTKKEILEPYEKFLQAKLWLSEPESEENFSRGKVLLEELQETSSLPLPLRNRLQSRTE